MSGIFGVLSTLFGGSTIAGIILIGMLASLLLRPERIVKRSSFDVSVLLLVTSIALPSLVVLFADFKNFGGGEGLFLKLLFAASSICTAGAVYFLLNSLTGRDSRNDG